MNYEQKHAVNQERYNLIMENDYVYAVFISGEIIAVFTGADGAHDAQNKYSKNVYGDRTKIRECTRINGNKLIFHDDETARDIIIKLEVYTPNSNNDKTKGL
jgi:hypothetical protein